MVAVPTVSLPSAKLLLEEELELLLDRLELELEELELDEDITLDETKVLVSPPLLLPPPQAVSDKKPKDKIKNKAELCINQAPRMRLLFVFYSGCSADRLFNFVLSACLFVVYLIEAINVLSQVGDTIMSAME